APDLPQLLLDDAADLGGVVEDGLQLGDLRLQLGVLLLELAALQGGQPAQLHVQDGGGLELGERVALHQLGPGGVGRLGVADQVDDLVEVGEGDQQALEDVGPLLGLAQLVAGPADDNGDLVGDVVRQHLGQVEHPRDPVDQGQHDHAEAVRELGVLVELVEDDLGDGVAAALDDQAGAFLVGLVGDVDDAVEAALADQVADADQQAVPRDLVGELGDDDALAAAVVLLDADLGPDPDGAAPGQQGVADPGGAHDRGAGGEVGALDPAEQVLAGQLGVIDQGDGGVDDLAQVVGRDLGRHADGDALRPVGQEVGEPGGQDHRLLALVVVVGREVDGLLVDVTQQLHGQRVQAGLGVPHSRRLVPVGGAEVALAVD